VLPVRLLLPYQKLHQHSVLNSVFSLPYAILLNICLRKLLLYICIPIFHIAAPVIRAVVVNYTTFIGSHITLTCKIIYWGKPKATLYWTGPRGESLSNDLVQNNDTHTSLLLTNLTEQDSGSYVCIADVISYLYGNEMFLYLQGLFLARQSIVNHVCHTLNYVW